MLKSNDNNRFRVKEFNTNALMSTSTPDSLATLRRISACIKVLNPVSRSRSHWARFYKTVRVAIGQGMTIKDALAILDKTPKGKLLAYYEAVLWRAWQDKCHAEIKKGTMPKQFEEILKKVAQGMTAAILLLCSTAYAGQKTYASWYSVCSCEAESGQHVMANGQPLDDSKLTCASWDYPFGTQLKITYQGRSVISVVTDRGPSRKLYKAGRRLDLSRATFERIAPLKLGVIQVEYEVVR